VPQATRFAPVHSTHAPVPPGGASHTPSVVDPLSTCPQWLPLLSLTQATHWLFTQREAPGLWQSVSATHCTQVFVVVLQAGPLALPTHWVALVHSTQRGPPAVKQACLPLTELQSLSIAQPAHTPVLVLHLDRAGSPEQSPLPVHSTHSPALPALRHRFLLPNFPVHWEGLLQGAQTCAAVSQRATVGS